MTTRVLVLAVLMLASGCLPEDQRTDTVNLQARESLPPAVVAQLDSGSAAFRARDVAEAERHYRRALEIQPTLAAGWFGLYMVARRRGQADSAGIYLERAPRVAPGATLIHPSAADDTLRGRAPAWGVPAGRGGEAARRGWERWPVHSPSRWRA